MLFMNKKLSWDSYTIEFTSNGNNSAMWNIHISNVCKHFICCLISKSVDKQSEIHFAFEVWERF